MTGVRADLKRGRPRVSRRSALRLLLASVAAVAVYGVLSQLAGLSRILERLGDADWAWLAAAASLALASFACYAVLFHRVAATGPAGERDLDPGISARVAIAALGAATLLSAGGAGAVSLEWALTKVGVPRWESALRLGTLLAVLYAVYLGATTVFGVSLWPGLPGGAASPAITLLPAALAIVVVAISLAAAAPPRPRPWLAARLARPAELLGTSTERALALAGSGRRGAAPVGAAVGFWAANIGALWACFRAFGEPVALAVLVQGFFVGMVANLLPLLPGGAGSLDAGVVGAFVALGEPTSAAIAAVLAYRLIVHWLPTLPEMILLAGLNRTLDPLTGGAASHAPRQVGR